MPFMEQMANIGSEVERALGWKKKKNTSYCLKAFERALELLDLTLGTAETFPRRREVARVRESLVDYFLGANQYLSTETAWKKYFFHFAYAARKDR